MNDEPTPPTGVWVEYPDGARYSNLPTLFVGFAGECALYDVFYPRDEPAVAVGMDNLPGLTSVVIPMLVPREDVGGTV